MAHGATRIQLCGRLAVQLRGERVEDSLPGPKGRLLFAYLVLNRARRMSRDELLIAVYGDDASPEQSSSLSVLLSKVRAAVGSEFVAGRSEIELVSENLKAVSEYPISVHCPHCGSQHHGTIADGCLTDERSPPLAPPER